ncbi:hypothetical protein MA16_Dca008074 [Dendrobium catenatum]|uniref:Uncharacterized protein n=1 Tax=Dendrobium catenatum TaxID=906689 RepID=A0A2I0WCX3_9ASPA|nr:hypothetical protein MA16_Dca008074 [Dendrobium catenatum]
MGDRTSTKDVSIVEDCPTTRSEGSKKVPKKTKADDVVSAIIEDSFISFRKKFYFPNDLVMKGRISFRSKWLDIRTRDPSKNWVSDFFFVHNDWGLQERWRKLKELPTPLHIGAEDLLSMLKLPDINALIYEMRSLSRCIEEEYLFKVGLSTHAGRSYAQKLKISTKVPEAQKIQSKRPEGEGDSQALKKKKSDKILSVAGKGPRFSPSRIYIPEDVLKHRCIGHRRAKEFMSSPSLHFPCICVLDDWNDEFVKVKYIQEEYKKKYDGKVKEMKTVENQLEQCITELANKIASASSQNERMDRLHIQLVEAEATNNQQLKNMQILEAENKKLLNKLSEKVAQLSPSAAVEEFKKSYAFKIFVEDQVQEARDYFYDVDVKALKIELMQDGFIKGFMKGFRAVQCKNGGEIEGLTPS